LSAAEIKVFEEVLSDGLETFGKAKTAGALVYRLWKIASFVRKK
jgi:hypothetical protein